MCRRRLPLFVCEWFCVTITTNVSGYQRINDAQCQNALVVKLLATCWNNYQVFLSFSTSLQFGGHLSFLVCDIFPIQFSAWVLILIYVVILGRDCAQNPTHMHTWLPDSFQEAQLLHHQPSLLLVFSDLHRSHIGWGCVCQLLSFILSTCRCPWEQSAFNFLQSSLISLSLLL